jgi:23S rRNA pseudouridine1911/1915/1917 synthase
VTERRSGHIAQLGDQNLASSRATGSQTYDVPVPPTRWIVETDAEGIRLDKFLAGPGRLGSRSRAAAALQRGKVFLNDNEMTPRDAATPLATGDVVRLWIDRPGSAHRRTTRAARPGELPILYEDDVLVAVNKPPGLLTVPLSRRGDAASVQELLGEHLRTRGRRRALPVHRIDRDTSGVVVFAARGDAQARLKEQFRRREPERVYLALVHGIPVPEEGSWRDSLAWDADELVQRQATAVDSRSREALSKYRLVERFARASLMEVRLVTGRRNQIRIQASLHGHPLVGEQQYLQNLADGDRIDFSRQALHALRLGIRHPVSGQPLKFEAPLPADMLELIARLRSGL